MNLERYVMGVDVGTGSARAGLFDAQGRLLASATEPIQMWHPAPDFAEQSSDDIWRAVCQCARACCAQAQIAPAAVAGLAFDATCSLVVLDAANAPLPVNAEGDAQRNVIVWMDHRALGEAEEINAGGHDVLRYVGGRISPEMEMPKLLWLKRNLPQTWAQAGKFLDLADFLAFRATDIDARSLCTLVCKWTYLGHEGQSGVWDKAFLETIGLGDLFENNKVGDDVRAPGAPIGRLSARAAADLGLSENCIVGTGLIDAHSGGLGVLGVVWDEAEGAAPEALEGALALIGGTSNCHMAVSREPRFIPGVWGPYFGAMVPGLWLNEGGQSAAGSAIDHVIASHANAPALFEQSRASGQTVYEILNAEIARLQSARSSLTKDIHVLPDFIGNRSPLAEPQVRGLVDGLSLNQGLESHALLYLATIQAVAYGTRDIIETMNRAGYSINTLLLTGGGTKNPLWLQEHADATGCTLVLPRESEAVLLGSAMLAATAAGLHPDLLTAMKTMSAVGQSIEPRGETAAFHAAKFEIFQQLYAQQRARRERMAAF